MNTLRAFITALLLTSSIGPSWAGTSTITTKDASGVTKTFDVITDGSGNFNGTAVICDGTAAANCAAVKAASTAAGATDPALVVAISPNNTVGATQSGAWNITNVTGTVSLPTGAATAALQGTNTATTAHTCSVAGFSELGCLGAVNDTLTTLNSSVTAPAPVLTAATCGTNTYAGGATSPLNANVNGALCVENVIGTPETVSATGTTAATTATLATAVGKTTYICGFSIRANATAAATGNATVTGTITGTLNFTQWTAPNASGLGVIEETFTPCVPASTTNTTIAIVSATPGTGGVVSVSAWGYQR